MTSPMDTLESVKASLRTELASLDALIGNAKDRRAKVVAALRGLGDEFGIADRWEGLEWTKPDAVLARQLGVSRERVRQVRMERGIAPSPDMHKSESMVAMLKWFEDNKDKSGTMTIQQVVAALGGRSSRSTVHGYASKVGFVFTKYGKGSELDVMNYKLPNTVLAGIWNVQANYIGSQRMIRGMGPAKWRTCPANIKQNAAMIDAEKARAAAWVKGELEVK